MHREIVISFKCNLTGNECKNVLLECNNCKETKTKDAFFVIRKELLGVPIELNYEMSVAKIEIKYLPKVLDKFYLKEVMFSDIPDIETKYPLYRKFLKEYPMTYIGNYYFKVDYPLVFESYKHLYMFAPDIP